MNTLKAAAIVTAGLALSGALASTAEAAAPEPAPATPQAVTVLGNSSRSNTALYAYHSNNCTGTRDFVDVGELAHGVGSVGSILIVARTSGSASPWYIIRYSDSTRCWRTPTAIATSVYLNHRGAGGW
jgi:hypothetical protein